jgi:hypothetical protein
METRMLKHILLGSLALGLMAAAPAYAKKDPAATVKLFDTDNDGTVDLAEAKKAAGALFDKLETDKDGTVTAKELQGRLSKVDLAAADPDKDGTLTKDEYLPSSKRASRPPIPTTTAPSTPRRSAPPPATRWCAS